MKCAADGTVGIIFRTVQTDKARIVKNTGWLVVRLGVATLSDLLVVRLLVGGFEVARFGAYAAILSVVSFVFYLRWAVELTISRFLSVACGRGDSAEEPLFAKWRIGAKYSGREYVHLFAKWRIGARLPLI